MKSVMDFRLLRRGTCGLLVQVLVVLDPCNFDKCPRGRWNRMLLYSFRDIWLNYLQLTFPAWIYILIILDFEKKYRLQIQVIICNLPRPLGVFPLQEFSPQLFWFNQHVRWVVPFCPGNSLRIVEDHRGWEVDTWNQISHLGGHNAAVSGLWRYGDVSV